MKKQEVGESKVARGQPPATKPFYVEEYESLQKAAIDTLIDAVKYFTTTAGIALSLYSQLLQRFMISGLSDGRFARVLAFLPIVLWLTTVLAGVFAVFPKTYKADNDFEKENAAKKIRNHKSIWVKVCVCFFVAGFIMCVYVLAMQLWNFYPFNKTS